MNKKILEWWHAHRLPERPHAKFVLMMLAVDADTAGCGQISQKRLARDTNLAANEIIDALIDLEKLKLLKTDIDERGTIDYQLNLQKKGERAK